MHPRRPFLAAETGQTFVEWLGVIVFVVFLVGVVVALVPDLGHAIGDVAKKAIDAVGG